MSLPLPTIGARIITVAGFSFPRTLEKLAKLVDGGGCSTTVLAANISSDPVLTALSLGRANDSTETPLVQISNAVLMLGLAGVRAMIDEVMPITARAVRLMAGFWAEANATATMCRLLGPRCPVFTEELDPELLHSCGLLHDLGSMVAAIHFTAEYETAIARLRRGEGPWSLLLKEELGADPGELGALVAKAWNLPGPVASAMRHHLRPLRRPDEWTDLSCVVHVARQLARGCGFVAGHDVWVDAIDPAVLELLQFPVSAFDDLLESFFAEMEELEVYEGLLMRSGR